jgi:hypothetical protein
VQVAPAEPPEDDDWEWEIAMAKARAEADPIPADSWPKTQELREDVKRWEPEPPPRHLVMPHQRVAHVPAKPPTRTPSGTAKHMPLADRVPLRAPAITPATPAAKPFASEQPTRRVTMVQPAVSKAEPARAATARSRAPSKHEETIRTFAAPPANDDHTDTAISLPPAPVVASKSSVPTSASRRVAQRQR